MTDRLSSVAAAVGWPMLGAATLVAGWWVATVPVGLEPYLVPPPQDVAAALVGERGRLGEHAWVTLVEVAAGFAAAAGAGVAVGTLLGTSRVAGRMYMPPLVFLHAIPKFPIAFLLVVALGFGRAPKVVLVVLVCTFPVALATSTGVARTPVELVELARSLDGGAWLTFVKVRLPCALPQMFVGLKQAAPLAVIGAVIGELFGATAGLGYLFRAASTNIALAWAVLILLGVMAIALFYLVAGVERLLAPWVKHITA